jgi:hypothetical protein
MKPYLYAVQDANGREILSTTIETSRVSDVEAALNDDGLVEIKHKGKVVATSVDPVENQAEVTLHRWDADAKLEPPVSKPLTAKAAAKKTAARKKA